MAIAQQKQQKYVDRTKIQTLKYNINDKVWLMLKNITTATENNRLETRSRQNILFKNYKVSYFPVKHPAKYRQRFSRMQLQRIFSPQISNDNHPGPSIINNENGTHEYDVEKIL